MAPKPPPPPSGGGFSVKLAVFLIIVAGIVFLRQSILLPLVGLLPAMVAYLTDRAPGRPLFQTVLACNACGVVYYVIELLFVRRNEMRALQQMLQSGETWLVMFGAAAIGYLVYFGAPLASLYCLRLVNRGHLLHLQSIQDKLRRDWGPTIEDDERMR